MAAIYLASVQLESSLKLFLSKWQECRPAWNDPVSREFEQIYVLPFENQAKISLKQMTRLEQVISQAWQNVK